VTRARAHTRNRAVRERESCRGNERLRKKEVERNANKIHAERLGDNDESLIVVKRFFGAIAVREHCIFINKRGKFAREKIYMHTHAHAHAYIIYRKKIGPKYYWFMIIKQKLAEKNVQRETRLMSEGRYGDLTRIFLEQTRPWIRKPNSKTDRRLV